MSKITFWFSISFLDYLLGVNPLSAKLIKWPNTLKQFVGNLPTNCLSVFGHFVGLALRVKKELRVKKTLG